MTSPHPDTRAGLERIRTVLVTDQDELAQLVARRIADLIR